MFLVMIGAALSCALPAASTSFGQTGNAAGMLYGRGVHASFAGNGDEAEQYLTQAIQSNPSDPRPYYFRALTRLRRGQDTEGRADMQAGAAADARAPGRWAVGSALERVQGSERLLLEDYRRRARLSEVNRRDQRNRERYEHTVDQESDVLRRSVDVPLDKLVQPAGPQELIDGHAVPAPRALSPADSTAERRETTQPAATLDDPFADDPVQPSGGETKGLPDKPRTAPQPDTGDEDLFSTPNDESSPEPKPENGDASDEFDEENPFGEF